MPTRTTLGLILTLTVAIKAAAALDNSNAIKQAGALSNGGQSTLRVGYDGDGCKGACGDEPLARHAPRTSTLKAPLGYEFQPPITSPIPTPESGARIGDYSEYYGAPKEPSKSNNAGGPIGLLVGSFVGGLGGLALSKFL
jgi:hypothetical protein